MAVVCLFSIFIFSALTTNLTDKYNNNTSKYLLISCVFTGNITHTSRFGETMNLNASFSTFAFVNRTFSPDHDFCRQRSSIIAHSFRRNNEFKLLRIFMFILLAFVRHSCPTVILIFRIRPCFSSAPLRHYRSTTRPAANSHSP